MFHFLNVNKPLGITSHDVVARVRRMLRDRGLKHVKVGHAGTLDPLATGVLIICRGGATRWSEYVMGHDKTYTARIRLGIETDTFDAEGTVISTADAAVVTSEAISTALAGFTGDIEQIPPMYSAIKQGGRKLYDLARAGQEVERQPRPVTIHTLTCDRFDASAPSAPEITCTIVCSAGTYIRSIAHDLGAVLGVGAHLTALERTASGVFQVRNAVTLELLASVDDWSELTVSPLDGLSDLTRLELTPEQWQDISHGRAIAAAEPAPQSVCATLSGQLVAILSAESGQWHPHKVFLPADSE